MGSSKSIAERRLAGLRSVRTLLAWTNRRLEEGVMMSIQPELWVDRAGAAIDFYQAAFGGTTSRMLLVVENPEQVVAQAIAAGAEEASAVGDEHGWRLGRIIDRFGHDGRSANLSAAGLQRERPACLRRFLPSCVASILTSRSPVLQRAKGRPSL
jgi:hypothetical protein